MRNLDENEHKCTGSCTNGCKTCQFSETEIINELEVKEPRNTDSHDINKNLLNDSERNSYIDLLDTTNIFEDNNSAEMNNNTNITKEESVNETTDNKTKLLKNKNTKDKDVKKSVKNRRVQSVKKKSCSLYCNDCLLYKKDVNSVCICEMNLKGNKKIHQNSRENDNKSKNIIKVDDNDSKKEVSRSNFSEINNKNTNISIALKKNLPSKKKWLFSSEVKRIIPIKNKRLKFLSRRKSLDYDGGLLADKNESKVKKSKSFTAQTYNYENFKNDNCDLINELKGINLEEEFQKILLTDDSSQKLIPNPDKKNNDSALSNQSINLGTFFDNDDTNNLNIIELEESNKNKSTANDFGLLDDSEILPYLIEEERTNYNEFISLDKSKEKNENNFDKSLNNFNKKAYKRSDFFKIKDDVIISDETTINKFDKNTYDEINYEQFEKTHSKRIDSPTKKLKIDFKENSEDIMLVTDSSEEKTKIGGLINAKERNSNDILFIDSPENEINSTYKINENYCLNTEPEPIQNEYIVFENYQALGTPLSSDMINKIGLINQQTGELEEEESGFNIKDNHHPINMEIKSTYKHITKEESSEREEIKIVEDKNTVVQVNETPVNDSNNHDSISSELSVVRRGKVSGLVKFFERKNNQK